MVYIPYRYSHYGSYWFEPDYEVGYISRPVTTTYKSYRQRLEEHLSSENLDLKYQYLKYAPIYEAGHSWKSWKYFNDYLKSYSSLKDLRFRNKHYGPLPYY